MSQPPANPEIRAGDSLARLTLALGSCAVHLRAEKGWREESDGSYVTDGGAVLEIPYRGGAEIPLKATLVRVRTNPPRIMPRLRALPMPQVDWLKGLQLLLKDKTPQEVRFGLALGSALKAKDKNLPLLDDRSYLYANIRTEFELKLPRGTTFSVEAGDGNTTWFVLDPCDPLVLLSVGQMPPGFFVEHGTLAISASGELPYRAERPVWDGQASSQPDFKAHAYVQGELGALKLAGLGMDIHGRVLVNLGKKPAPDILQRMLPGTDLLLLPHPVQLGVEGAGRFRLPLPVKSNRIPRGSAFSLNLAGATLIIDGGKVGQVQFTGNVVKVLEGTPFAELFQLQGDTVQVQGYYRARDDWGLRLRSAFIVAGHTLTNAALVFRVNKDGLRLGFGVPDGEPEYTLIHWTAANTAQVAAFLHKVGYDALSTAKAFREVLSANANEATQALARVYELSQNEVGRLLRRAGYGALELNVALQKVFKLSSESALAVLRKVGYSPREVEAARSAQENDSNHTAV